MSLQNFKNITYPLFGLYSKPYNISFTLEKIYINRNKDSHKETVDDKSLQGDYFARLLQLEKRVDFDCTCKDLQQLIFKRPKWGMDSKATPFDLSGTVYCRAIKRKIVKTRDNLIWLQKISYPFTMQTNEDLSLDDTIFAVLISINNEWFIKEFTFDDTPIDRKISI